MYKLSWQNSTHCKRTFGQIRRASGQKGEASGSNWSVSGQKRGLSGHNNHPFFFAQITSFPSLQPPLTARGCNEFDFLPLPLPLPALSWGHSDDFGAAKGMSAMTQYL